MKSGSRLLAIWLDARMPKGVQAPYGRETRDYLKRISLKPTETLAALRVAVTLIALIRPHPSGRKSAPPISSWPSAPEAALRFPRGQRKKGRPEAPLVAAATSQIRRESSRHED